MRFVSKTQENQVLEKITPLVQNIADKRVQEVMDNLQASQIKAYEAFFEGQEKKLEAAVNTHIDRRLKELGILK